jgi:hypothetical protein
MRPTRNYRFIYVLAVIAILAFTALIELRMGRLLFCKCGLIRLWSGNVWSNQASQQFFDPYTFTHILHGVLLYALVWKLSGKRLSVAGRFVAAVMLESAWEVFENTDFIIQRYRDVTVSLDYFGDSVLNSIGDICAMMLGFVIASRLPVRITVIGSLVLDALLLLFIRDSLALNILMLIYPIQAIKNWQMFR